MSNNKLIVGRLSGALDDLEDSVGQRIDMILKSTEFKFAPSRQNCTFELLHCSVLLVSGINCSHKVPPDVLHRIQVRRTSGPVQNIDASAPKIITCEFAFMDWSIILLECGRLFRWLSFDERQKMFLKSFHIFHTFHF